MSAILVLTKPRDFHTYAVAEALRLKGERAVLWHGTDFPSRQTASFAVSADGVALELTGPDLSIDRPFEIVWNRRLGNHVLPETLHPADRLAAGRNCQHFMWSLWHLVGPDAFWVNPLAPIPTAVLKPHQLRLAREVGLAVPATLFSNDPRRIEGFLDQHPDAIYKSFHGGAWKTPDGVVSQFTSPVTRDDLPEDDVLQACPGIFQERVAKDHELRVTFFGDLAVTARLRSQENPLALEDWRAAFSTLAVEPGELPEDVTARCRQLMRRLGIVFGCFDFIVTPEGGHVFLEINPMGQFLFLERLCPELPMLDLFADLLLGADPAGPAGLPAVPAVRLADVWSEAERQMIESAERHVLPENQGVEETDDARELPEPTLAATRGAG